MNCLKAIFVLMLLFVLVPQSYANNIKDLDYSSLENTELVNKSIENAYVEYGDIKDTYKYDKKSVSEIIRRKRAGDYEAMLIVETKAKSGVFWAQIIMYQIHINNPEKFLFWLERMAEQGDRLSMKKMGATFTHGKLIKADYKKGFYYSMEAAKKGDITPILDISNYYNEGLGGVAKDIIKAYGWMYVSNQICGMKKENLWEMQQFEFKTRELRENNHLNIRYTKINKQQFDEAFQLSKELYNDYFSSHISVQKRQTLIMLCQMNTQYFEKYKNLRSEDLKNSSENLKKLKDQNKKN